MKLEYRMYFFVPYQLTGIQGGIQSLHASTVYAREYRKNKDYKQWETKDFTVIVLNGGTTNTNKKRLGTLNVALDTIRSLDVKTADFYEPDLGDQLTSFCFLVDNRVWDKKMFPDFKFPITPEAEKTKEYNVWRKTFSGDKKEANKIIFLRNYLKNFKLA